jgi:hypothetical protein
LEAKLKVFPHTFSKTQENGRIATVTQYGMDLRDWFAGQALAGILANSETKPNSNLITKVSYKLADEMMEARKQ